MIRVAVFLVLSSLALSKSAFATCPANPASPSVTVCQPANGTTVTDPIRVFAHTTDNSSPVNVLQVYVDGVKSFEKVGQSIVDSMGLNALIKVSQGKHAVTVQAYDRAGKIFNSSSLITVSGSDGQPCDWPTTPAPEMFICAPLSGAVFPARVFVLAFASSARPVSSAKVYLDGALVHSQGGNGTNKLEINTTITANPGKHRVTVQAWDSDGRMFNAKSYIRVQ